MLGGVLQPLLGCLRFSGVAALVLSIPSPLPVWFSSLMLALNVAVGGTMVFTLLALFAQIVWIACGLFLYLTVPGASLFSGSAAAFLIGSVIIASSPFQPPHGGNPRPCQAR